MARKARKRGLGYTGASFDEFARQQEPRPTWRSLKLGRNPVSLFELVMSVPLIQTALARIDSFGADGREYPLSVVVRWLFMMPLCHLRCLEHMADRLSTDEAVKWAVLGDPLSLGENRRVGIPPTRPYISKQVGDHLDTLLAELQHLYDSMIAALLRWDPLLKYGLINDRSMVPTWGNPERPEWERDDETGRWRKTGRMLPATDPDAWSWRRRRGHDGDEEGDGGFGYGLSALAFCRRPIPFALSLKGPKKGHGERITAVRMLTEALQKFGPLLEVPPGELAVFIADAGLPSKEFFAFLRANGYEPVMPYTHESDTENILADKRLVTRKATRDLATGAETGTTHMELDLRWDGTPLCPRTDWDRKQHEGGRRPLVPLPSDLERHAQRWRCPMDAVGECAKPCPLAPYYKNAGRSNMLYPRVKKLIENQSPEDGFHYVLFPRIGAEAQKLLSYRGRIEHDFSYMKGRGCFGGDGEARLPIRTEARLRLRLLCTFIPLVALALIELGVPMPAELLDNWFSDIEELPPSNELAA